MFQLTQTSHQIVFFIIICLSSILLTQLLARYAEKLNLMDVPSERKNHGAVTPLVGGLAIYLVLVTSLPFFTLPEKLYWLLLSSSILVLIGAVDDAISLGVRLRFLAQIVATLIMIVASDLWISSLSIIEIPAFIGVPFTILAVVGLTNAFNLADGIDGLSSGQMLLGLLNLTIASYAFSGEIHQISWLILLVAAVFGFFLVNLSFIPKLKAFLGDAGSLLLGFIMSWTLIYYTQKPVGTLDPIIALWCVTIPVFDTIAVILGRIRESASLFRPDRTHLHHLFLNIGSSRKKTLRTILLMSALANSFGLIVTYLFPSIYSLIIYLLSLITYLIFYFKFKSSELSYD